MRGRATRVVLNAPFATVAGLYGLYPVFPNSRHEVGPEVGENAGNKIGKNC
jgi:hypothetical protein